MATPPIDNLLTADNTGVYQRLLDRALAGTDISLKPYFVPYLRALSDFESGQADCIFSFTDVLEAQLDPETLVSSYPLGAFRFHIFTGEGTPAMTSLTGERERRFGAVQGHQVYLNTVLPEGITIEWVRSQSQLVRMLELDRINAIIGAIPDMQPYTNQLSYDPGHPLLEAFDRLTCQRSDASESAIDTLSRRLRQMHRQGEYQAIADDLYLPFKPEDAADTN